MEAGEGAIPEAGQEAGGDGIRFEDLTVDDDLPIIERVVRCCCSGIALQRLVHVKMLAETSELSGPEVTQKVLVPAISSLAKDPESVIRQHLAAQLLPLAIIAMMPLDFEGKAKDILDHPGERSDDQQYDEEGYHLVTTEVMTQLNHLVADVDLDVRRAAADSISGLAIHIRAEDVAPCCLPVPLELAMIKPSPAVMANPKAKKNEADQLAEELRITAANLLAELGGAASEHEHVRVHAGWVQDEILPVILELCSDVSFRVRRSAVQALPRILGACDSHAVAQHVMPKFDSLSHDDVYRVRKSTGECLVDMSRSLMILAARLPAEEADEMFELRRARLIPIADRLIQDSHKMVRQGMMQFLGPFIASFYPYQASALHGMLPTSTESDGSNHMGIVAQFFPHATSMVSRLNSAQNAVSSSPTPVHSSLDAFLMKHVSDMAQLHAALPPYVRAAQISNLSLRAVTKHREQYPPDPRDIEAIMDSLLDYFAALAIVSTGDENTDAEMRVYCAYSFPAVVLLLGPENWEGSMKSCFFTLINPNYGNEEEDDVNQQNTTPDPPLPVKRCLASSLHTVAHILGPDIAADDILPVVQNFFLRDGDDSVRLNVIRNFPSLLQLLDRDRREEPVIVWSDVVRGDEFLGSIRKRSQSNPLVLNWRQRDYLARSLPDMVLLLEPRLVREYIWPILQILVMDSISDVREDAIWSIPMLFKIHCPTSLQERGGASSAKEARALSQATCGEAVDWLIKSVLKEGVYERSGRAKPANFSERQLYCRICLSVGLAIRFSEELTVLEGMAAEEADRLEDPVSVLSIKFKSFLSPNNKSGGGDDDVFQFPFSKLTKDEEEHMKRILLDSLLPPALEMKEDRISNVRVTLMKVLQLMPEDIQSTPACQTVLHDLVAEVETWESFGTEENDAVPQPPQPRPQNNGGSGGPQNRQDAQQQSYDNNPGPVDVDEVAGSDGAAAGEDHYQKEHSGDEYEDAQGDHEGGPPRLGAGGELPPGWKNIVFEAGPIGLQLEPTVDDLACRVYGFLDAGAELPSPARASGLIEMGDVIVAVNGREVSSYDETISILKAGGRREITFRPGTNEDEYDDEYGDNNEGEGGGGATPGGGDDLQRSSNAEGGGGGDDNGDDSERREREKKAKKAAKKAKKEARKESKKESKKEVKKEKKKKDKKR